MRTRYSTSNHQMSLSFYQIVHGLLQNYTKAGFTVAVATNQSGVTRGLYDEKALNAIHEKMLNGIKSEGGVIHHVEYCKHLPEDNCSCRKPKPGMLLNIAKKFNCSLINIPFCWR